jgi:hypothetical protein
LVFKKTAKLRKKMVFKKTAIFSQSAKIAEKSPPTHTQLLISAQASMNVALVNRHFFPSKKRPTKNENISAGTHLPLEWVEITTCT